LREVGLLHHDSPAAQQGGSPSSERHKSSSQRWRWSARLAKKPGISSAAGGRGISPTIIGIPGGWHELIRPDVAIKLENFRAQDVRSVGRQSDRIIEGHPDIRIRINGIWARYHHGGDGGALRPVLENPDVVNLLQDAIRRIKTQVSHHRVGRTHLEQAAHDSAEIISQPGNRRDTAVGAEARGLPGPSGSHCRSTAYWR